MDVSRKDLGPGSRMGQAAGLRRRILLVEDNAGDANLACEHLAAAHAPAFDVVRASTLKEAHAALAHTAMDAIVLDLNLPDSRGADTVRHVRQRAQKTPIIAVSGLADEVLRARAMAHGAEDLFAKHETHSRLFWRSVAQIIDRKREQQRQFQHVLDATPDAILVVNDDGVVRYVNQAAVDLFGRSREELLGEPLGFSVRDDEPAEVHIQRADGDRICEMRIVRMDWDEERANLASVRDVTERKRAEQLQARSAELEFENRRIQEASRLKSAFLANMSHELRTPLNAIIGFGELLVDGVVDPGSTQYKVFAGHILSSGKHLLQLINDVLDLARVESGKLKFNPEPVDLGLLTRELCATLEGVAAKRRVVLTLQHDPLLTGVQLDPGRFKQVLYNYVSNAIKFSHEGALVHIHTRAESGGMFRLEVRDSGVGIAPKDIGRLFAEFEQLEAGTAKRHQGTGLGLALTKRLVEAQGGWVGVSSIIGKGSEFYAVLPQHAGSTPQDTEAKS